MGKRRTGIQSVSCRKKRSDPVIRPSRIVSVAATISCEVFPVKTWILFALALAATDAAAAVHAPAHTPIRPISECLRIDRINEWYIVDDRTAIVRTGPKRYRVDLQSRCPRLGLGPAGRIFRANPSNQTVGDSRICGEVGETVRSQHQPPCAIQSVRPIDKATFDRLSAKARRHGSAADQPTVERKP